MRLGIVVALSVLLAVPGLVATPTAVYAQATGSITGRVVSVTGVPVSAAQVYIPDTELGALTNDGGRYLLLNVPAGDVELRVQLVGFREAARTVTVASGQGTVADFTMTEAPIALGEIVVTGTGVATERRQLGNTVATISTERLVNAPVTSFSELIQAREPSVVALTSDGGLGSGARIRIRGSNSISMLNEPLVYVDGLRMDNSGGLGRAGAAGVSGSPLDDINWESIERVEILKGAAAATLYGSEASSGIIQLFTKSGRSGPARVTARVESGSSQYPNGAVKPNAGFARTAAKATDLSQLYGMQIDSFQVFERDFFGDLTETGRSWTGSADVSGGVDEIQYYLSARYSTEDGPLGGESLGGMRDRLDRVQVNSSMRFITSEKLAFRVTAGYADKREEGFVRNNHTLSATSSTIAAKPEDAFCSGSGVDPSRTFGTDTPVCTGTGNPWGNWVFGTTRELAQFEGLAASRHLTGSLGATWTPRPGLSADLSVGMDQVDERLEGLWPYGWRVDGVARAVVDTAGQRSLENRTHRELTTEGRATWTSDPTSDLSSSLTIGAQAYFSDEWKNASAAVGFPAPGVTTFDRASRILFPFDYTRSKVGVGAFVQEQVGFRGWLFGTAGVRFDRTSAFGSDAGSAVYPKAGVSAMLSELDFWPSGSIPTFRLRAAIGQAGLQPGAFDKLVTYVPARTTEGNAFETGGIGNPDLRPERATELEIGAETELLDGRAGLDVTYWDRVTRDALVPARFAAAGGFLTAQLANLGRLDGHGLEVSLRATAVDRPDVSVGLFANASYLSETVADLGGFPSLKVGGSYQRYRNFIVEGYAPGAFFGAQLIPICGPSIERVCYTPGVTVPYDIDKDSIPDTVDAFRAYLTAQDSVRLSDLEPMRDDADGDGDEKDHYLGKPTPDWQGSFGADVTLQSRLTVRTLFEYRAGNYGVANLTDAFRRSGRRNVRRAAEVEATLLNPATRTDADAREAAAMAWATELISLDPWSGVNLIEAGDMIRWRELSVTYRLPDAWANAVRASDLSITLTGRNLAVWTSYTGTDPEANAIGRCGGGGEVTGLAGGTDPLDALNCNYLDATDTFTLPLPRRLGLSIRGVF